MCLEQSILHSVYFLLTFAPIFWQCPLLFEGHGKFVTTMLLRTEFFCSKPNVCINKMQEKFFLPYFCFISGESQNIYRHVLLVQCHALQYNGNVFDLFLKHN